jgi:hypothetical protein
VSVGRARGSESGFDGLVDEFTIYRRALSATEVAAIWAAGASGKCKSFSTPPVITSQPQSQLVDVGSDVNLQVVASGTPPLSYQWQFNGTNLSNAGNISGSGTTNLLVNNVQSNNVGNYRVVVTNTSGSATSSVAALTLRPPAPPHNCCPTDWQMHYCGR